MKYLGIDVSKKSSHYYLCDANGERLKSGKLDNVPILFADLVAQHVGEEGLSVALEVGNVSFGLARAMESAGADVFIVNPYRNALIRESLAKTDSLDAKQLCEQRRLNQLPAHGVLIPDKRAEELRYLVSLRARLVAQRTRLSNMAVRVAERHGYYPKKSGLSSLPAWELILNEAKGWPTAEALGIRLEYEQAALVRKQIAEVEKQTDTSLGAEPFRSDVVLLKTIPGLGEVTIACLASRVGDIKRFPGAKAFCQYIGLAPRQRQSGKKMGSGRITKEGNSLLRGYLTQAAMGIIARKTDGDPLYIWYQTISKKKGWKKARVALARKLAAVIYGVLKHRQSYNPAALA